MAQVLQTNPPDSSTAQRTVSELQPVVVSLGADGAVSVDGKSVPATELGARLAALAQATPKKRFIVNADEAARWQAVVQVMDALRKQGIEAITFATKRVDS